MTLNCLLISAVFKLRNLCACFLCSALRECNTFAPFSLGGKHHLSDAVMLGMIADHKPIVANLRDAAAAGCLCH